MNQTNTGWIPLYREELNDILFEDQKWFRWWLWLRLRAAYKPSRQLVGATHRTVTIMPGEIITTKAYLCRIWGANIRAVTNFLEVMQKLGRLRIEGDKDQEGGDPKKNQGLKIIIPLKYIFPPKTAESMEEAGWSPSLSDEVQDGLLDGVHDEPQALLQDEAQAELQEGLQVELQTNKEYKNKEISVSNRERETQFFEEFKKSEITLEEFCMSLKPMKGKEEMLELAEVFYLRSVSTEDFHPSFSEFKKHFFNWAKGEIAKTRNTQNTPRYGQEEKGAGAPKRASDQRRGTDAQERTAEDYE